MYMHKYPLHKKKFISAYILSKKFESLYFHSNLSILINTNQQLIIISVSLSNVLTASSMLKTFERKILEQQRGFLK